MAAYTLSGFGTKLLTAGTTSLSITISAFPAGLKYGNAHPSNYYHIGLIRPGLNGFWQPPLPLEGLDVWLPLPAGTTMIGYWFQAGVTAVVSEGAPGAPTIAVSTPANNSTVSHVGFQLTGTSSDVFPSNGTGLYIVSDYGWATTLGGSTNYVDTTGPATVANNGNWTLPINEPTFTSHSFWNFFPYITDENLDSIAATPKWSLQLT